MSKLIPYRTQRHNANRHTPRGLGMLRDSIGKDGWIGALTVAADGETFDGSARLETLAEVMPDAEPIVVETDGHRPVIVRRTDIPDTDDPRAKRLGIAANRVQQVDYDPDPDVLKELAGEIDLTQFWKGTELDDVLNRVPDFLPVGIDEQGRLDQKKPVTCPHCGREFILNEQD